MRYIILAFLPFLAVFLQSTFFNQFSIKGSIPDLVLIFVVYHALFAGARKGTIYGMLCGLLEDLYVGRLIGVNVLTKGLIGYIMGKAQGNVFKENLLVGIMAVLVGTLINSLAVVVLLVINGRMLGIEVIYSILYQAFYNLLLAGPIYLWYYYSTYNGWLRTTEEN
jgi:rod shape-determining protein MreD